MKELSMISKNLIFLTLFALTVVSCSKRKQIVEALPDDAVVMKYEGGTIKAGDVKERVDAKLKTLAEEAIEEYKRNAQQVLVKRLLDQEAKKLGLANGDALLQQKAEQAVVTEAELEQFMKENKARLKGYKDPQTGKTRDISKEEIRSFLSQRKKSESQQSFISGLMAKANSKMVLEVPRIVIPVDDSPFKGGKSAKVVIHEFSDFQCPYCSKAKELVDRLHKEYGDKVKILFRDFPLSFHPEAKPAAVSAICAQEQGKFWEMHDKIFDNQKAMNKENYSKWAGELGLDIAKYTKCVADPSKADKITADMKVAESLGVNSTPTFFVNGRKIPSALPFTQFKAMIDEELRK